ncbi:MAG TPA: hypothetical protein VLH86_03980 [Patescibacteria group bacterium]|nr:hypothetical protein [Patescibacteria group bacterium]
MKSIPSKLTRLLGSRQFFYGVVLFFIFESIWVACSAVYPMAFDEDFHLGIIKIYSHHWLPFLEAQPNNAAQFGALQHDPSYLFHYLMSFPYRLISLFTADQTIQVVVLRLLNVALAATGVVLFRKVLLRAGTSAPLAGTILALFVLVPIMPLLAGQINYDNLMLPVVAGMCLLVFRLHAGFAKREIDLRAFGLLAVVCLLGSLVKYPFLPVAAAAALFVVANACLAFRSNFKRLPLALERGYRELTPKVKIGLLVAVVLSTGLFLQRYGVNAVRYHTLVPKCDVVLSEDQCEAYGPWIRNHELAQAKQNIDKSPLNYTLQWVQSLHYRLFFMVNGPQDSYRNYPPLPLPSAAAIVIVISGVVALLLYRQAVFRSRPLLVFLGLIALLYCSVLWADNYSQYIDTGEPVAINGRYLLPVLMPLAAVFGRAMSIALGKYTSLKLLFASVALLLFLQGGGVLSFISRSDELWDWPNSVVIHTNNAARRALSPVLVEGNKYY